MVDYAGQQYSEYIMYVITILFGAIAWFVGYWKNDFKLAVNGWFGGLVLALVLCAPDWPMYNKKPVTWLKEVGSTETTGLAVAESSAASHKKDKGKDKKKNKDAAVPVDVVDSGVDKDADKDKDKTAKAKSSGKKEKEKIN